MKMSDINWTQANRTTFKSQELQCEPFGAAMPFVILKVKSGEGTEFKNTYHVHLTLTGRALKEMSALELGCWLEENKPTPCKRNKPAELVMMYGDMRGKF